MCRDSALIDAVRARPDHGGSNRTPWEGQRRFKDSASGGIGSTGKRPRVRVPHHLNPLVVDEWSVRAVAPGTIFRVTDYDVLRVFCGANGGYGNELGVVREGSVLPDPAE